MEIKVAKCNCENSHCEHSKQNEPCKKPASFIYIEQLGRVCDECGAKYPDKYKRDMGWR